jgi:ABC-2 type transport system ATP-binding protein
MDDNIVVIGKGKLIANTSMQELIEHNGQSSIFIRSTLINKLEKALKTAKLSFVKDNLGLKVSGVTTDEVGKIASTAGVTVLELTQHAVSLEDAFLELTADALEYSGKDDKVKR